MGCGVSSNDRSATPEFPDPSETLQYGLLATSAHKNETVSEAFQRLDEEINTLESVCPGARLATVEAWIEHLSSTNPVTSDDPMFSGKAPYEESIPADVTMQPEDAEPADDAGKVCRLAIQLGIGTDVAKAMKNEEFLASVSRNALRASEILIQKEMIEHSKRRANGLIQTYSQLRNLYAAQDGLLASITGGAYFSPHEQRLDSDLEAAREVRDKLSGVSEQWRTSGYLLRISAKSSIHACEYWTLIGPSKNANDKITSALDCRKCLQYSLSSFEAANSAIPQVEIPFITRRQTLAVRHVNVYMLTDIVNEVRYKHTKKILEAYKENLSKAVDWLHETYKKTLKKDLMQAEENVLMLVKKLRQERVKNLNISVGHKPYIPSEHLDPG